MSNSCIPPDTVAYDNRLVSVTATNNTSCTKADSLIGVVASSPEVFIANDMTICPSNPVILNTDISGAHLWNNSNKHASLPVRSSGTYWVKVTGEGEGVGKDTISVSESLGIVELNSNFCLYPTPTRDGFWPKGTPSGLNESLMLISFAESIFEYRELDREAYPSLNEVLLTGSYCLQWADDQGEPFEQQLILTD